MTTRRRFIGASATALLGGALPWRVALARPGTRDHYKFIFVHCAGGWDVLNTFVTDVSNSAIEADREPDAFAVNQNGIDFMAHPNRPSVEAFFSAAGSNCLLIHGIQVPSIAHDSCNKLIFTGSTSSQSSDWGAALASGRDELLLPHTIVDGFGNQGRLAGISTRIGTNGRLEPLIDGSFAQDPALVDVTTRVHGSSVEAHLDAYLAERGMTAQEDYARPMGRDLAQAWSRSQGRATDLKALIDTLNWDVGNSLPDQLGFAVEALSSGLSRCVTVKYGGGQANWDSHGGNDTAQSSNFETLFNALLELQGPTRLGGFPGEVEATLAEETVVVVLSEMARTPTKNGNEGRDHWSYTSMLLFGAGITGGRVVGGYDDSFYGKRIDPASGEVDEEAGVDLHAATIGATLMELVDIDFEEFVPGYSSIPGFLDI